MTFSKLPPPVSDRNNEPEIEDQGGNFTSSQYTVPVTGNYHLSVSVTLYQSSGTSTEDNSTGLHFRKDGAVMAGPSSDGYADPGVALTTSWVYFVVAGVELGGHVSGIFPLTAGEVISVYLTNASSQNLTFLHKTFTGFLI